MIILTTTRKKEMRLSLSDKAGLRATARGSPLQQLTEDHTCLLLCTGI